MEKNTRDYTIHYTESLTKKGFVGVVAEMPGVISQGRSVDELKMNLTDALVCMMTYNKAVASKKILGDNNYHTSHLLVAV